MNICKFSECVVRDLGALGTSFLLAPASNFWPINSTNSSALPYLAKLAIPAAKRGSPSKTASADAGCLIDRTSDGRSTAGFRVLHRGHPRLLLYKVKQKKFLPGFGSKVKLMCCLGGVVKFISAIFRR